MTVPHYLWGLDDANFFLLSAELNHKGQGSVLLGAIQTEATDSGYECRLISLNFSEAQLSQNALSDLRDGRYIEDISTTSGWTKLATDPDEPDGIVIKFRLNPLDKGRWCWFYCKQYPDFDDNNKMTALLQERGQDSVWSEI